MIWNRHVTKRVSLGLLVALVALVAAGCSIWPFSLLFGPPKPKTFGIAWSASEMGGTLPGALQAQRTARPATLVRAQGSGIQYTNQAAGVRVVEVTPFTSGTRLGFYAWQEVNGERTPVSADWSVSPSGLCQPGSGSGSRLECEPKQVGAGKVMAVIGSTTTELPFEVFPGFMLDNGTEYSSGLDAQPSPDRGQIGFDFAAGGYVTDRGAADLYIAENGDLIAPGGIVALGVASLAEATIPSMTGASNELGNGTAFPPDVPGGVVHVLRTRGGKHVAVQPLGTYATVLYPYDPNSAPGYRAYAFGYRYLD